jgi:hypothetical protein
MTTAASNVFMEKGLDHVNAEDVEDAQDFMSMIIVVKDVVKSSWDCMDP